MFAGNNVRAGAVRSVLGGRAGVHAADAAAGVPSRLARPRAGRRADRGGADGHVRLLPLLHGGQLPQQPLAARQPAGRAAVADADHVPDHLHPGRVVAPQRERGAPASQARSAAGHFLAGGQFGHVGHQQPREEPRRVPADAPRLLWRVGVDHYHARVHAAGRLLPLPLHRVPARDLEDRIQAPAQRPTNDHIKMINPYIMYNNMQLE